MPFAIDINDHTKYNNRISKPNVTRMMFCVYTNYINWKADNQKVEQVFSLMMTHLFKHK